MGNAVIKDHWKAYMQGNEAAIDRALAMMAADVERYAKMRVPVKKARLLQSGRHQRKGPMHYTVSFNTEYAAAQEKGEMTVKTRRVVTPDEGNTFFTLQPGTYKFKNYTKKGTGKNFLKDAGQKVADNGVSYFKTAALKTGL